MIRNKRAAGRFSLAFFFVVAQCLLATQMVGCGYLFGSEGKFRDRSLDYQKAEVSPPLVVPDSLPHKTTTELLPIPVTNAKDGFKPSEKEEIPQPNKLVLASDSGDVQIKSKGDHKQVVLRTDKATAETKVKAFLENTHIQIVAENSANGSFDTDWLLPKKEGPNEKPGFFKRMWRAITFSAGSREKFQFRTAQDGELAQISIWHYSKRYSEGDTLPSTVDWSSAKDDTSLANDMLDALFAYLQDEKSSLHSPSFLPKALTTSPRSDLTNDGNGFPVLVLRQDFNHAWYQVGEALQKSKVKIDDINRSLGIYYLQIKNPSDDKKLDIQVKLVQADTGVQVNVQKDDESFAPIEVCNSILTTIKGNLTY